MEPRLATVLYTERCHHTFLDLESYDQYDISSDDTALAELNLGEGSHVFLTFNEKAELIAAELAWLPNDESLLRQIYESATREKFNPEVIQVLRQTPGCLKHLKHVSAALHRAVYVYRRDPVALVIEFTRVDVAFTALSERRVPLVDLVREIPSRNNWQLIFKTNRPYHGPYGELAENAYRQLTFPPTR